MKIIIFRFGIVLLGLPVLYYMLPSLKELLSEKIKNKAISLSDAIIALALFCLANMLGTIYVFFIQSTSQMGLFYASTTIAPIKLNIFWGPINPYGIIFGIVIVLFYTICRQGMGRTISVFCVLMFMLSSNHLHNLIPSILRDYARVPFIFSEVLIMALLVGRPLKQIEIFVLSAIAGLILGIGLWVREDLMLFVFPFVFLLIFFLPGPLLKHLKTKAASCIIFLMFALALMPSSVIPSPRNSVRVIGGLMSPSDIRLGITSRVYDYGYQFSDEFAGILPYAQASVINPQKYSSSSTDEENKASSEYLSGIINNFPADILARAYASTLKIVELPFAYAEHPLGISSKAVSSIYSIQTLILDLFSGHGLIIVVLALFLICIRSFREALFCLFFLLYFTGYPSLQFQGRHYFHLEFIGWWCLGFVIQHGGFDLIGIIKNKTKTNNPLPLFKRGLAFGITSLLLIFGPLLTLRQYQILRFTEIINECNSSEFQQISLKRIHLGDGMILFTNHKKFKPARKGSNSGDYLMAEFVPGSFKLKTLWPILSYNRIPFSGRMDFSRTIIVPLEKGITRIFFPVIYNHGASDSIYFSGIKMSPEEADCLLGLYFVKKPSNLPLLLTIKYPINREYESLYKKINEWELPNVHSVPWISAEYTKNIMNKPFISIDNKDVLFKSDNIFNASGKWIVKGYAQPQKDPYDFPLLDRKHSTIFSTFFADVSIGILDTDLLRTKGIWLKKGSCFIACGKMQTGGATFGLIRNGKNYGYVTVADSGDFSVVIEVPMDGMYSIGVANNLDGYTSLENNFVINRMGWVKK